MKLYRYRPLSELIFKELYYQELYLSSYIELNDPLDMNTAIDFSVSQLNQVKMLIQFLTKTLVVDLLGEKNYIDARTVIEFTKDQEKLSSFNLSFYNFLSESQVANESVFLDNFLSKLLDFQDEYNMPFKFDIESTKYKLEQLTAKFFHHSYIACFSETNSDFLMWSHYANKHSGICIEYSLESGINDTVIFPYEFSLPEAGSKKYEKVVADIRLQKVNYGSRLYASFFDFMPIFSNEDDCDLLTLSKSYWHYFERKIESIFLNKTKAWRYEKEWRIIEINFDQTEHSEERIRHYSLDSISAIYFGLRTPNDVKNRIHNIYKSKQKTVPFYDCSLTNGKDLKFDLWTCASYGSQ